MKYSNSLKPDFTLILPCYNESEHINQSIEEIVRTLDDSKYSYEIILIDDKSNDGTQNYIRTILTKYKNTKAFFHSQNQGRGATVAEGIIKAKTNIVGFIDFDLEISPVYIPKMVSLIKNNKADVVIGARHYPFEIFPISSLLRDILGRGYHFLVKTVIGFPLEDTEAGYKFFNKRTFLPTLNKIKDKKWFWDTETVIRSHLAGLKIMEIPVLFLRRSDKTSTVKIIPDSIEFLKNLLMFHKKIDNEYPNNIGLLYNFPKLYKYVIKILFGKDYPKRYEAIARNIEEGSKVVDVCCGNAELSRFLKEKNIEYLGVDINIHFVLYNIRKGIRMCLTDITKDDIPKADYIILQGSLYQFHKPEEIVEKLYYAASKSFIISESIHNLADNYIIKKTPLKKIIPLFVGTKSDKENYRFDETTLKKLLQKYKPRYSIINGRRDLIAIIKKSGIQKP